MYIVNRRFAVCVPIQYIVYSGVHCICRTRGPAWKVFAADGQSSTGLRFTQRKKMRGEKNMRVRVFQEKKKKRKKKARAQLNFARIPSAKKNKAQGPCLHIGCIRSNTARYYKNCSYGGGVVRTDTGYGARVSNIFREGFF